MPEVIEIGGLALNGMVLTALISALAGYGALRLWTVRERGGRSGPWGDLVSGAALIAAVIWKFGVLFREPSILREQPLLLLLINGSGAEAYAGLAAAGLYWIWQARRRGVGLLKALDALAVSAAGGLLAWNALSAFEYRWGYAAVCAALLALLIGRRAPAARGMGEAVASEAGDPPGSMETSQDHGAGMEWDAKAEVQGADMAGSAEANGAAKDGGHADGEAAVLAGYVLGAGCLVVSLFAVPAPWVRPPELFGLTSTQLIFIAAGLAAAALDYGRSKVFRKRGGPKASG